MKILTTCIIRLSRLVATHSNRTARLFATLCLLPLAATAGSLTNAGYGTESTLMGGADIAVARDSFAINTNPAGLVQLTDKALDKIGRAHV